MKIQKQYYSFERLNFNKVIIRNIDNSHEIGVMISKIVGTDIIYLIDYTVLTSFESFDYTFDKEAIYRVDIYYPDSTELQFEIDNYELRYFKSIKDNIIHYMKDFICNCNNLDNKLTLNCTTGAVTPTIQDVYDLEFLYNGVGLYRDLLLSTSFTRPYQYIITTVLTNDSPVFLNLLNIVNQSIIYNGKATSSIQLLRRYTAYLYVLYYVIEEDIAEYESISNSGSGVVLRNTTDNAELEQINQLFDLEGMNFCFNDIGLDIYDLYNRMKNLYVNHDIDSDCQAEEDNASIFNLSYDGYSRYVFVNQPVSPNRFTWDISGEPENLILDDSDRGISNVPVSGTEYPIPTLTYVYDQYKTIIWTLKGSNVAQISTKTTWVHPAYWGKVSDANNNPYFPDANEIITTGRKELIDASLGFTVNPHSTDGQFTWFAVAIEDAGRKYNFWQDLDNPQNKGIIGDENSKEFIIVKTRHTVINGVNYYVYKYSYNSAVNNRLKISTK